MLRIRARVARLPEAHVPPSPGPPDALARPQYTGCLDRCRPHDRQHRADAATPGRARRPLPAARQDDEVRAGRARAARRRRAGHHGLHAQGGRAVLRGGPPRHRLRRRHGTDPAAPGTGTAPPGMRPENRRRQRGLCPGHRGIRQHARRSVRSVDRSGRRWTPLRHRPRRRSAHRGRPGAGRGRHAAGRRPGARRLELRVPRARRPRPRRRTGALRLRPRRRAAARGRFAVRNRKHRLHADRAQRRASRRRDRSPGRRLCDVRSRDAQRGRLRAVRHRPERADHGDRPPGRQGMGHRGRGLDGDEPRPRHAEATARLRLRAGVLRAGRSAGRLPDDEREPGARHHQPDGHAGSRDRTAVSRRHTAADPAQPRLRDRCPASRIPGAGRRRNGPGVAAVLRLGERRR